MKRSSAIRRLFAVLVTAALVWAPVWQPAMAAAPHMAMAMAMADQMADEMAASASAEAMASGLAEDMQCCPSKAPAPVDCDKCVFMACCMSIWVPGPLAADFEYLPIIAATLALERDDARLVGLGQPPPERPPRVLV